MRMPFQQGFSLLEMLLSLALVALVMTVIYPSLNHFLYRYHGWQTLNSMVITQQVVHKTLVGLHEHACHSGLMQAKPRAWQLALRDGSHCVVYDVRFGSHNGQWQKRKQSGVYTSFLADTDLLNIQYGIAQAGQCTPVQWLTQLSEDEAAHVVMIHITLATGVVSQHGMANLPATWFADTPTHANSTGDRWYWQPMTVLIPLPCVATL